MAEQLETIEVQSEKSGGTCVINRRDYDPAKHLLPGEEPKPKGGAKGKKEEGDAGGEKKPEGDSGQKAEGGEKTGTGETKPAAGGKPPKPKGGAKG